jgi:hypothetical protein
MFDAIESRQGSSKELLQASCINTSKQLDVNGKQLNVMRARSLKLPRICSLSIFKIGHKILVTRYT